MKILILNLWNSVVAEMRIMCKMITVIRSSDSPVMSRRLMNLFGGIFFVILNFYLFVVVSEASCVQPVKQRIFYYLKDQMNLGVNSRTLQQNNEVNIF
jgi:hypothetical protein